MPRLFPSRARNWYKGDADSNHEAETDVWSVMASVLPRLASGNANDAPAWPPDMFAVCSAALYRSGAYKSLVRGGFGKVRLAAIDEGMADEWIRCYLRDPKEATEFLAPRWIYIREHAPRVLLSDLSRPHVKNVVAKYLLELARLSDIACRGFGMPISSGFGGALNEARDLALDYLDPTLWGSTLCAEVHPTRAVVLPKVKTPGVGITYRSFTHHLAYVEPHEVRPFWHLIPARLSEGSSTDPTDSNHSMNVLLMPWPDEIMPAQFTPVGRNYFSFRLREDPVKISRYCADVVKEAKRMFGEVHAVIFPECSLGRTEHKLVRDAILGETALLIAGISDSFGSGEDLGVNSVNVDVSITPNTYVSLNQPKHHRWRLDDDQIAQYNLGSRLLPSHSWYEGITLQDRRISFLALRRWMVLSVLICEDLARQDPVGTILRNVGPHLVVALLMDGPQISPRWPGRYAMGLADDPGSAVLTLTSRGMMKLSRPVRGVPRRESIALWKGATGPVHEIDAPEGAAGVVLSLTAKEVMERSLDSRDCPGYALELSGVREVRVPHGDQ